MAAEKLIYRNKLAGDLWTSRDANEVKSVVNSHADDIDSLNTTMDAVQTGVTRNANNIVSHNTRLNTLESARQTDEAQIQQNTSVINALYNRQLPVWQDELPSAQKNTVYPYQLNIWDEPLTSLSVVLGDDPNESYLEYKLRFTVSGDDFALTFYETGSINNLVFPVRWANDEPEWEDGLTYEVSLMGGLAVAAGWAPE